MEGGLFHLRNSASSGQILQQNQEQLYLLQDDFCLLEFKVFT